MRELVDQSIKTSLQTAFCEDQALGCGARVCVGASASACARSCLHGCVACCNWPFDLLGTCRVAEWVLCEHEQPHTQTLVAAVPTFSRPLLAGWRNGCWMSTSS